ncbi:TPA: gluconokinase, GntK/IdnK-type, partial [Escherichia coli]
ETGFIVCSSLKKQYRDILRKGSPHVHFLWLDGDYETILARMQRRAGHFMPVALLKSQFEALERPQADEQDIVRIDINHDIANVTEQCRQAVLAIRQNRICAKEGSASDQRCE